MTISFNDMNAIASHKSSIVQTGRYTELQNVVFGLNTVFLVLAMIAIGLRVWSRRLKRMRLMMNDIVASVSLIVLLAYFALISYGLCTGMGRHITDLGNPPLQLTHLFKLMVPLSILWSTINTLIKISIIDLYIRIFPAKRLRLYSYLLLGISCTYWVIAILFAFLNCRPFSYTWDRAKRSKGHCIDDQGGTLGFGIVNLILDIAVIILPLPHLYTLQLILPKRIGLMFIFALGFVITAISAIRINSIISFIGEDFSHSSAKIAFWSFLETSLSVINCCLPTIKPALAAVRDTTILPFNSRRIKELELPSHEFTTLTADNSDAYVAKSRPPIPSPSPLFRHDKDVVLPQKMRPEKETFHEEREEFQLDACSIVSTAPSSESENLTPSSSFPRNLNMRNERELERAWC